MVHGTSLDTTPGVDTNTRPRGKVATLGPSNSIMATARSLCPCCGAAVRNAQEASRGDLTTPLLLTSLPGPSHTGGKVSREPPPPISMYYKQPWPLWLGPFRLMGKPPGSGYPSPKIIHTLTVQQAVGGAVKGEEWRVRWELRGPA